MKPQSQEKPGNAAAMREALNKVGNAAAWIAENCNDQQTAKYMNDMIAIVQTALSEPARQCDVGTAEEQDRRRIAYCRDHSCKICPLRDSEHGGVSCDITWAQKPYTSEKGGAE